MDKTSNPSKTILVIVTGFLILHYLLDVQSLLLVAIGIATLSILSPFLARKIEFLWMKLAWLLSQIVPNMLLTTIFFGLLFPLALLSKLSRKKNALQLRNSDETVFVNNLRKFEPQDFEKSW